MTNDPAAVSPDAPEPRAAKVRRACTCGYVELFCDCPAAPRHAGPTPEAIPVEAAAARLRGFIQYARPGQCKILSRGDECVCPLCDVDRLVTALASARAALTEAQADAKEWRELYEANHG